MALPALNWRYCGVANFTSGSLNGAIDALYTLGTATTYADGSARTPGSGSAWTWAREQSTGTTVAAYGNPPTNALGMRYIVGGSTSAVAYTVLTPDTATATGLLAAGMQKGAGVYTTWGSATPFTVAGFSGYWRAIRGVATISYDSVSLWESQEACVVQWAQSSTGNTSILVFGAVLDPGTTASAAAESDGRIYCMMTAGNSTIVSSTFLSSVADGAAFGPHSGTTNASHAGYFQPGTNNIRTLARMGNFSPGTTFANAAGEIAGAAYILTDNLTGNYVGAFRNLYIVKDQFSRVTVINGSTPLGYTCGAQTSGTAGDCVFLRY